MQARIDGRTVRLLTRKKLDWTADYVRLRKSTQRGCVDMQAIVSAICAHAWHDLRPLRWLLHRATPGAPGFAISQRPASTTTADSLIQFVAVSGHAGRSKRIFGQFSLRRSSSMVWQRLGCAIIKAGLDGGKTSPVHWGCCLGLGLNEYLPADAGGFVLLTILKYDIVRVVAAGGGEVAPSPEMPAPIAHAQVRELHPHAMR
jgi:hypothetical protein